MGLALALNGYVYGSAWGRGTTDRSLFCLTRLDAACDHAGPHADKPADAFKKDVDPPLPELVAAVDIVGEHGILPTEAIMGPETSPSSLAPDHSMVEPEGEN